jgi:hypothetical protein
VNKQNGQWSRASRTQTLSNPQLVTPGHKVLGAFPTLHIASALFVSIHCHESYSANGNCLAQSPTVLYLTCLPSSLSALRAQSHPSFRLPTSPHLYAALESLRTPTLIQYTSRIFEVARRAETCTQGRVVLFSVDL